MRDRRATVQDVHERALAMPYVTVLYGPKENPIYQVGGKSFVFFRTPRPDAVDPDTGERYPDVIMIWVESEAEKLALVQDEQTPFFSTPHFDAHPSVLVRASRLGELSRQRLAEQVQDAWLSRASKRRAQAWLALHSSPGNRSTQPAATSRSGRGSTARPSNRQSQRSPSAGLPVERPAARDERRDAAGQGEQDQRPADRGTGPAH